MPYLSRHHILVMLILFAARVVPMQAFPMASPSTHVNVELIQEDEAIQPGRPFWVAIHFAIEEGWHIYWKNPGDAGIPLKVEWALPAGFEAAPLEWPVPEKFTAADMVGFGYHKEATFLTLITPPSDLDSTKLVELKAKVNWLVCSSMTCQPGSTTISRELSVSREEPKPQSSAALFFKEARAKIPKSLASTKAKRKGGIVKLEFPHGDGKNEIREIHFFPEEQNTIDYSSEPLIEPLSPDSLGVIIDLKEISQQGTRPKNLKGVLVIKEIQEGQESVQGWDIDTPIVFEADDEVLSFVDTSHQTVSAMSSHGEQAVSSSFEFEGGVGLALLFAFLGGMILNLMPCVLPVMSFKVMSFVKMAGQSRALTLKHGAMFSLGVILSFWVLASVMLMLRTYGQAVGWGFQLQEPLFVVILASLLFIFALSLFGLFEWGMFVASWAGQTQADSTKKTSSYWASFLSGILATAVATPCTGPFLGSAVGFAVTLPIFQSLLIFTSLGLGMCFPYLLLAAFPSFLRFMPKPGPWMETFKQLMGFLLLATVLWLIWVFSAQTDSFSVICVLAGFFCFSVGGWIYGRGCTPFSTRLQRVVAYVLVLLFGFAGVEVILFPRASWYSQESGGAGKSSGDKWAGWEEFSPERVAQLRSEGKPVFIDFTAKWCLICQANHMVLASEDLSRQLNDIGVVKMKADWTKNDPVITEALSQFGRNSVPLYVFYGPDGKQDPVLLPQVLTPDVVVDNINKALPDDIALR